MTTKYIFVTGGVVSSLGKGLTAASLGRLLKSRGLKVRLQKFDPYINVDPGKMSPLQHGEIFVTADGAETDLDIGHYERFTDINLDRSCDVTTGMVYKSVLQKDAEGFYDGSTIQVIPHITNEILERAQRVTVNHDVDIVITEIGGTVGDIEAEHFLEAIRQAKYDFGRENVLYIHMTLVPYLSASKELKTKPTQHSVKELRGIGIQPDMLILRTEYPLTEDMIDKVALFCDMDREDIFENQDVESIYELPLLLEKNDISRKVLEKLNLEKKPLDLSEWNIVLDKVRQRKETIRLAMIAKYVDFHDAYLSVHEALEHAGIEFGQFIECDILDAEKINKANLDELLKDAEGILIPSGFGDRGLEGMVLASKYARENNLPILGTSMGMHAMALDICRNVLEMDVIKENSFENNSVNNDIVYKPAFAPIKGRLGNYPIKLEKDSLAYEIYGQETIYERHRNEFELNLQYEEDYLKGGLKITGKTVDEQYAEIIELKNHPFFLGIQYEAQFISRPTKPHPLYLEFLKTILESRGESVE